MLVSTLEMPGESLGANQGNSVCWDMAIGKKASGALSAQGRDQKTALILAQRLYLIRRSCYQYNVQLIQNVLLSSLWITLCTTKEQPMVLWITFRCFHEV